MLNYEGIKLDYDSAEPITLFKHVFSSNSYFVLTVCL